MRIPLRITDDEHVPIYLQIVHQVRYLVTSRQLVEGSRLPSVRELADQLGINSGTVALAYRTLQQERLIESRRGKGTYVADPGDDPLRFGRRRTLLNERTDALIRRGYALGFDAAELKQHLAARVQALPRRLPLVLVLPSRRAGEKYAPIVASALSEHAEATVVPLAMPELDDDPASVAARVGDAYFFVTFQSAVPQVDTLLRRAGIDGETVGVTARLTEATKRALHDLDPRGRTCVMTESRNVASALTLLAQYSPLDVAALPVLTERSGPEDAAAQRGATVLHTFGVLEHMDAIGIDPSDRLELAFTLSDESRARLRALLDPQAEPTAAGRT